MAGTRLGAVAGGLAGPAAVLGARGEKKGRHPGLWLEH